MKWLFKRKKKFTNSIQVQKNGLVFLGCPCSTLEDGSCKNCCGKISVGSPCVDCPSVSIFYIAIGIQKEIKNNELLKMNMHNPTIELFIGES